MVAGIDLGTTYSLIATIKSDGKPILIRDKNFPSEYRTPTSVVIDNNKALVGMEAELFHEQSPNTPINKFFKRKFGDQNPFWIDTQNNNTPWKAASLAGLVLKKLRLDFEAALGIEMSGAVITIPAHFDAKQRKAVAFAAQIAEIELIDLLEEPAAAALHYGLFEPTEKDPIIFVYDFGGGTFDATVLTFSDKGAHVIAKEGDSNLGGKELDEVIMGHIYEQVTQSLGDQFNYTFSTAYQLRRQAEQIKIAFSNPHKQLLREQIYVGSQKLEMVFRKSDFESDIQDAIQKTIHICKKCLQSANLPVDAIDHFLLVGGSSMLPLVKNMLIQEFSLPQEKFLIHQPLEAVVYGAALHAAQKNERLSTSMGLMEFHNVSGFNIGIRTQNQETKAQEVDVLIRRNAPLPTTQKRIYYTSNNNQKYIRLEVVQFLDDQSDEEVIGELRIGPIPKPKINYPVEVQLTCKNDGRLQLKCYDPKTGRMEKAVFEYLDEQTISLLEQKKMLATISVNGM